MKKSYMIPAFLAAAAVLTACGAGSAAETFSPTADSLYIKGEGTVTSAVIEECEKDYYTEDGLRSYAESALTDFNNGSDLAELNNCTLADGKATLLIDFKNADAYLKFMETYPDEESAVQVESLDVTTVEEGAAKGFFAGVTFKKPGSDSKTYEAADIEKKGKLHVAAIEGDAEIVTDGAIQYVSDGVSASGHTAQISGSGVSYIIFK